MNMKATSAVTVPLAGWPDRRKHSRSNQLRIKGSLTVPSITCSSSHSGESEGPLCSKMDSPQQDNVWLW